MNQHVSSIDARHPWMFATVIKISLDEAILCVTALSDAVPPAT